MFVSIRRHQKWLWFIIIAVIILSFVVFFSPTARFSGSGGREDMDLGTVDGEPIERRRFLETYRESLLSYLFRFGEWPAKDSMSRQNDYDADSETRNRLLLLRRVHDLGIRINDEGAAKWIANSQVFKDRQTGLFKQESYDMFVKNKLAEGGLAELDFHRFARNEGAIQHLVEVVSAGAKLISTGEGAALYRQENDLASVSFVHFSTSNFVASVAVTPDEIGKFYTNRMSLYRNQDRVQVGYVRFMATNYTVEAANLMAGDTNLSQQLDQIYLQRGVSFFVGPDGKQLSAPAAKEKIREEIKTEFALRAARRAAAGFAEELFAMTPVAIDNLEKLAAAKKMLPGITQPFDQRQGPTEFNVLESFINTAFKLTAEEPFSVPLLDHDSVFIIGLKGKIPSNIPPLETIRERVTADFIQSRTREAARKAGEEFAQAATNTLAQGKSFQDAASATKLIVKTPSPFSKTTRSLTDLDSNVDLQSLKSAAFKLQPGRVSGYLAGPDGGFVVYLRSIAPADEAVMKSELPKFMQNLQQRRQIQAFNDWFIKERELAKIESPGGKKTAQ